MDGGLTAGLTPWLDHRRVPKGTTTPAMRSVRLGHERGWGRLRANALTDDVIDIEIAIDRPELRLWASAKEQSLPVVRQALRSFGDALDAEREALDDAELALTEACANVVEHAYSDGAGEVEVSLRSREAEMLVRVRDRGRGMSAQELERPLGHGYGMALIEGVARSLEVSIEAGTEIGMAFDLGAHRADGVALLEQPCERILRRLVAVVAAQADMPVDRMMEALLVTELVAHHGLPRVVGDRARIRIVRDGDAFALMLGPLEEQGAAAIVRDSEVPVVGSIVERLADRLRVERERVGERVCEHLELRIEPRPRS